MKKSSLQNYIQSTQDQWMTPDLLSKLKDNPTFIQSLSDPEIMQAVGLMQANPTVAKEKYKDNKKITEFFVEFSKLMGGHFEQLSKKQEEKKKTVKPSTTQDKPMIQEVKSTAVSKTQPPQQPTPDPEFAKKLEDPTIKSILAEPKMVSLINALQSGANIDLYQVAKSDPVLASKLRYLMDRGILGGVHQR